MEGRSLFKITVVLIFNYRWRFFIVVFFLSIFLNLNAQKNPEYPNLGKVKWTSREWRMANTARFSFYMPHSARESIRFMNLARINGEKFSKIYIEPIADKNIYEQSLEKVLNRISYRAPLKPSRSLSASSLLHSVSNGLSGNTGEWVLKGKLFLFDPLGYGKFTACNSSYGVKDGLAIALNLLIDSGVPLAGHRKNILDSDFSRVGAAGFYHKKHGNNVVFAYSSYSFMDLLLLRKPDNQQIGLNIGLSHLLDKPMCALGLTYVASHLSTSQLFADFNYQLDLQQQQLHGLSAHLNYGSSKGLATNFMGGLKTSAYYHSKTYQSCLTLQPTITWFLYLNLMRNRILWEINSDNKPAVYRVTYGYQFCIAGQPELFGSYHNITVSRYLYLKSFSKKKSSGRKRR